MTEHPQTRQSAKKADSGSENCIKTTSNKVLEFIKSIPIQKGSSLSMLPRLSRTVAVKLRMTEGTDFLKKNLHAEGNNRRYAELLLQISTVTSN